MSQLIRRLRADLARATQDSVRIELSAILAMQLARVGDFDQARVNIAQARGLFIGGYGGIGTVWVMLAEALIQLFEHQSPQALTRICAAQALALATKHPKLIANTSAWKAHIQFENSDFPGVMESLAAAFANAAESDLDARTRLAIILFSGFSASGELDKAQTWFSRAHAWAIKNGDQASVDALLYNKAAFVLGHLRVKQCANALNASDLQRIRMEFSSSQNLNSLTGISALANHMQLVNSRLLMLEGQFEQAIHLLTAVRFEVPFSIKNFNQDYVDLEICFCNFRIGNFDAVESYLKLGLNVEFDDLDIDENIVSTWMRLQMAGKYVQLDEACVLQPRLAQLCASYFESRKMLISCLDKFS